MNKYLFYIFILISSSNVSAQLVTNSNVTPNNLVQNTLLGAGVNAFNISYTGSNDAIGFFNGSSSNIGLSSGIIMTTGTVRNRTSLFGAQQGPFGPNDEPGAGFDNNEPGYGQLNAFTNGTDTYNAAVLEFDFEATGSIVSFNYVFASEEYIEFVNAGYNDVFAFLISGPGIIGSKNIAIIPGTTTPVTIDNVNDIVNSAYYIDNGTGNSGPQNNNNSVVQYDGFTTVLTATSDVVCGETYHIKIAIADAGDGAYDSGVFLEGGSFTSPAPMLVNSQVTSIGSLASNQLLEGCSSATISFTRSDSINFSQTFQLNYSGAASNGIDYSNLPNSVTFNAGQANSSIVLQTIADNIVESTEDFIVTMVYSGMCGQQTVISTSLEIVDQTPLNITMPPNLELSCITGNSIVLAPIISGGTPNYNYNWNTGETSTTLLAAPIDTTTYILTVTDACGTQIEVDSVRLTVAIFDPLVVTASNDTIVYCPNSPVEISAVASGGAGSLNYQWSNNGGATAVTTVQTLVDQNFIILVTDQCGNIKEDSLFIDIVRDTLATKSYGDTTICPYGDAVIGVNATSGTGDYRYDWDINEFTQEITASPSKSSYFYVNVYDSCNTYFKRDSVLVRTKKPVANFLACPIEGIEKLPITFNNLSQRATDYEWYFGNDDDSYNETPTYTYYTAGEYEVTLVAIDNLGCRDTTNQNFIVHPEYFGYVPNAFTPNGDGINDTFNGSFLGIKASNLEIFNRWGELIYQSSSTRGYWNGTENNKPAKVDVYIYKIEVTDYSNITHSYKGHINLIR